MLGRLLTLYLVFGCWMLTGITPARAQQPAAQADEVAALARRGTEAVRAGRGEEAVQLYLAAFKLDPTQSTLLYNIALTYHRVIGDLELARTYYRRFLAAPTADPELLGEATRGLEALRQTPAPAPPSTIEAPLPPAPPQPVERPVAPWVLVGIGGAVAVGGGVLAAITASDHGDFESSADADDKRTLADRGRVMALGADAALGVGVTTAAIGLIWWAVADDGPSPAAGGAGLPAAVISW